MYIIVKTSQHSLLQVEEVRTQLAVVKANEEKKRAVQLKKLPALVTRPLLTKDYVLIDGETNYLPQSLQTMTALQVQAVDSTISFILTSDLWVSCSRLAVLL